MKTQLDTTNFWAAFGLAAYQQHRDKIFAGAKIGAKATPEDHPPNNWDYTKRIHRRGYGWKKLHES